MGRSDTWEHFVRLFCIVGATSVPIHTLIRDVQEARAL